MFKLIFPLVCLSISVNVYADTLFNCDGKYKNGINPSKSELKEIVAKHSEWYSDYAQQLLSEKALNDARRANLCGADL